MDSDDNIKRFDDAKTWLSDAKDWISIPENILIKKVETYAASGMNKDMVPMKYLYSSGDMDVLLEMVPRIVAGVMLQEFEHVNREDELQVEKATDEDKVMQVIACYTWFVCIANPNFGKRHFNGLFVRFWKRYFERLENEMCNFWEEDRFWRDGFRGCLLFGW